MSHKSSGIAQIVGCRGAAPPAAIPTPPPLRVPRRVNGGYYESE